MKELSKKQLTILLITRVLMGWYCLYEGLAKLMNPNWSAYGFLMDSKGIFSEMFKSLAANQDLLAFVDFLNVWGLIAIGLSLILGLLTRPALISGIVLLSLYYLSHPALLNVKYALPPEGSYLWVNKNLLLIFILALLLVFPTSKTIGIDRLIFNKK